MGMREASARGASCRLQTAMEYLMTYGWAILVIAIVLGVLYYFGVFSGPSLGNSCIPSPGYVCTDPVMNSTGNLSILFTQISGSAITITGVACTSNSSTPAATTPMASTAIQNGNEQQLVFSCIGAGGPIGRKYAGYLWIAYSSGTQTGLIARIAAIETYVSTGGSALARGGGGVEAEGYVPVTLSNSQSSATPSTFQQLLTVNSNNYGNYINPGWTNVEFTTGPAGSGSVLNAWVEANPSNTATNTVVWVQLTGAIGAGSNTVIYMDFMKGNVMSGSGPTGEASWLSTPYGRYDDGKKVFTAYYNMSTNPITGGNGGGNVQYSINSVTGPTGVTENVLQAVQGSTSNSWYAYINTGSTLPSSFTITTFEYLAGCDGNIGITLSSNLYNGYEQDPGQGCGSQMAIIKHGCCNLATATGLSVTFNKWYTMQMNYISGGTIQIYLENFANELQESSAFASASATDTSYTSFDSWDWEIYTGGAAYYLALVVIRAYPPGGVMPTASYGSFV